MQDLLGGVAAAKRFGDGFVILKAFFRASAEKFFGDLVAVGHFNLLPLFPRRGGLRCATHELNYTRNACKRKGFLRKISEAVTAPHNSPVYVRCPDQPASAAARGGGER